MLKVAPELPQADVYPAIFNALSEPIRLDIVRMIADADELACTLLDDTLPISKSTLSYHIKVLYHAGLITLRKAGRYYFYRVRQETFEEHLPGFLERLRGERSRVS
jgi:DNA-binding transcriptional ArsR family regulator